jgi:hypothetical protein
MEIQLYLSTKKGVVRGVGTQNLPPMGYWGGKPETLHAKDTFVDYSIKGKELKLLLEDIASKHGFELRVYDTSRAGDAIRAKTAGVNKTPAVIINGHKFEGDFEIHDILAHIFGPGIENAGYMDKNKKYICPKCESPDIKVYNDLSGFCNACGESFVKAKD